MLTQEEKERYSRQILIDSFTEVGQEKLKHASVLVIGAGGLGCPALTYLAGAGIGHLGIVDPDIVELSNLHRQSLYCMDDIGMKKVKAASRRLQKINSGIYISEFDTLLNQKNAFEIINEFDVIIDGTDNFLARFIINDTCSILNKVWVYGSVYKFEGQVSVFNAPTAAGTPGPDYRSLFPDTLHQDAMASCETIGTLGVIPGIVGMLQATEAIKVICNYDGILSGKLLTFDALKMSFETFAIGIREFSEDIKPTSKEGFLKKDYQLSCASPNELVEELTPSELNRLINEQDLLIIDIREANESTPLEGIHAINHPWSALDEFRMSEVQNRTAVFICMQGNRSRMFIQALKMKGAQARLYSLRGGIEGWRKFKLHH
ncbi:MAG: HesA/MoeB/ThiF family protein [Bacteroidia bacterium]|nr:HesA/MoeB/ThiF family protein [Bacteroidia bacterium]